MRNQPPASYQPLPNSADQIPQLTQKTLNLIIQAINSTVAKTLDQRLGPDRRQQAIAFDDPAPSDS